jgi:murein DD-endopeptidase MepM/ murein hydrolase activator NlpD
LPGDPLSPVVAAVHRIMKLASLAMLLALGGTAIAAPKVTVSPKTAHPGEAVLVTVTGSKEMPKGSANNTPLEFFAAKSGFQALIAIPLDAKLEPMSIEIDSAKLPVTVVIKDKKFAETDVIVEDEMANPPKADRDRIDADNAAIIAAANKGKGTPQFTRAFKRPPGEVTSQFGEWRTFNDGHRSQHLGTDLFATEASPVKAVNAGTVTLVRDTFLAGNTVVVAHGGGMATAYYHLSKATVAEGDVITQGTEIGLAGHTGRTTGPHLHLSVRVPGGWVDPVTFFKLPITAPVAPATAKR